MRIFRLARLLKVLRLAKLSGKGKARPENDPSSFPTLGELGKMMVRKGRAGRVKKKEVSLWYWHRNLSV